MHLKNNYAMVLKYLINLPVGVLFRDILTDT